MEDLQVEDFNDPIEHKAEQTADGIKTPENQENDEEQTSIFKEIMSWVIPFAIALVAALLIKNFLIINADVPTGSMENTILPGDRFIETVLHMCLESQREGILLYSGIRMTRVRFM